MHDAFSMLPDEVLYLIFNLVPYIDKIQFRQLDKKRLSFYQDSFAKNAEGMLTRMYDLGYTADRALRVIEDYSIKQAEFNKDISLWDSILFMLMIYINNIEEKRMLDAKDKIATQIAENDIALRQYSQKLPHNEELAQSLKIVLFMLEYAKSDAIFKARNRKKFLEYARSKAKALFFNFNGSDFSDENLAVTKFFGSSFVKAKFCGANLTNADMRKTNSTLANLSYSVLCCTDYRGANLLCAKFTDAAGVPVFDHKTILIGAVDMPGLIKEAAETAGAILTLTDLAKRIKNDPENFSEVLLIKCFRVMLQKKIASLKVLTKTDNTNLLRIKIAVLENLHTLILKQDDIEILRNGINDVKNNLYDGVKLTVGDKLIESKTKYSYISERRDSLGALLQKTGLFKLEIESKDILDDIDAALEIIPCRVSEVNSNMDIKKNYSTFSG